MINLSNLVSLWSETDPAMIGDDSTPTLTLGNSSSGLGLKVDTNAQSGTGTAVDALSANTSYAARIRSAASAAPALTLLHQELRQHSLISEEQLLLRHHWV